MAPIRLKLTMELARAFSLGHLDGVSIEVPAAATRAELELIHDPVYIDLVQLAGRAGLVAPGKQDLTERVLLMHGLGTEDDPVFVGMHEAAAMVAGATLAAARAVWTSAAQHGASVAGGLHHAMVRNASGFCVYNDPAIAWLRPGCRTDRVHRRGRPSRRRRREGDAGWLRAFHAVVPPLLRGFRPQAAR
jgi:acetoin utilization protein AcuC